MTCDHLIIKYLGQQHTSREPKKDRPFDLYNCLECHSTVNVDVEDYMLLFRTYYVSKCMSGSLIPLIKYVKKKNGLENKIETES